MNKGNWLDITYNSCFVAEGMGGCFQDFFYDNFTGKATTTCILKLIHILQKIKVSMIIQLN